MNNDDLSQSLQFRALTQGKRLPRLVRRKSLAEEWQELERANRRNERLALVAGVMIAGALLLLLARGVGAL